MSGFERLAFVDVETTGVDPRASRVTEIGVVTVDHGHVETWTTLVNPARHAGERTRSHQSIPGIDLAAAPRFRQIAAELEERLRGRLLVAHNARFDYGFLRAEFDRVGRVFESRALCSLMLSRRLERDCAHHDLDSLAERHGLAADVRHRALPDAMLLWQFWQALHRAHPATRIAETVEALLAGPLLPAHLHPEWIDKLPQAPGIYVFHDERGEILFAGKASAIRSRVVDYFRIGTISARALDISHRIRNITWRQTQGLLGAELALAALRNRSPSSKAAVGGQACSWQLDPTQYPSLRLTPLSEASARRVEETFGIYATERMARNSLARLAATHRLCHALLGIPESAPTPCPACPADAPGRRCGRKSDRLKQLMRTLGALRSLRVSPWPYPGPIGIRERSDLHIVDRWQYCGTARNEAEIASVLETRPPDFDLEVHRLLASKLPRLASERIVLLSSIAATRSDSAQRQEATLRVRDRTPDESDAFERHEAWEPAVNHAFVSP